MFFLFLKMSSNRKTFYFLGTHFGVQENPFQNVATKTLLKSGGIPWCPLFFLIRRKQADIWYSQGNVQTEFQDSLRLKMSNLQIDSKRKRLSRSAPSIGSCTFVSHALLESSLSVQLHVAD